MSDKITKSTIGRIAGNILGGPRLEHLAEDDAVIEAVRMARKVAAEVERTAERDEVTRRSAAVQP